MLDAIRLLADAGIDFNREAVELAAWFHGAITKSPATTTRSAPPNWRASCWRRRRCGEVARLVLVTKTHKVPEDDVNGAVLSDADLSVLGIDAFWYRIYPAAGREEHADVPNEVFKPARARILGATRRAALPYRRAHRLAEFTCPTFVSPMDKLCAFVGGSH
jgi:predicted metal-dependent HD superfamily phosphohydrolase